MVDAVGLGWSPSTDQASRPSEVMVVLAWPSVAGLWSGAQPKNSASASVRPSGVKFGALCVPNDPAELLHVDRHPASALWGLKRSVTPPIGPPAPLSQRGPRR